MKHTLKRLLCALLAAGLLAGACLALAPEDSLATLSWLSGSFLPQAVKDGAEAADKQLQQTFDSAKEELDSVHSKLLAQAGVSGGTQYSEGLSSRDWSDGGVLELPTGSVFLMLDGAAGVTHSGAVIDVTQGSEVPSGARLAAGHRYLVGEDTAAQVTILSGAARLGVQGGYTHTAGRTNPTPFFDVCQTDWFYSAVGYVYERGLFSGMEEHAFSPGSAMNRAMLMTVLYRLAGTPEQELHDAQASFSDVPGSAWYAPYVRWGASQGITAGTGENIFSPELQITREQLAVLLYSFASNYMGLTPEARADLSGYVDLDSASDWAREALSWAVSQGIISSASADALVLNPKSSATRVEVSAMLRAFSEKVR